MSDTTDTTDYAGAKAALAQALIIAGPILTGLQQADKVFSALQNAEVYTADLLNKVAAQQATVDALQKQADGLAVKIPAIRAEIGVAEQDANMRIAAAQLDAQQQIQAAKDQVAQAISDVQVTLVTAQQAAATGITTAQDAHDTKVLELQAEEKVLQDAVTVLEEKLATLKAAAATMAASLTAG